MTKPLSRIKFAYFQEKMGIVEITPLVEREEMTLQVGREHCHIIELRTIIFKFEKWSNLGSPFPVQKVV